MKSFLAPCRWKIIFFVVIFSSFLLSATPFCIDLGRAGVCLVQLLGIFPLTISSGFFQFFAFLALPTAAFSYLIACLIILAGGKAGKRSSAKKRSKE